MFELLKYYLTHHLDFANLFLVDKHVGLAPTLKCKLHGRHVLRVIGISEPMNG